MLMKFVGSLILLSCLISEIAFSQSEMRESALKKAAINNRLVPLEEIYIKPNQDMAKVGKELFESELLSLNSNMSCQTCHLDEFGSADGLPNAIGTGGEGEGPSRMMGGGDIVPRNTLPLWGRGTKGFNRFFWDGKVQAADGEIFSQFGDAVPSKDPLVVSVHLPFVEVREMVARDNQVESELLKENQNIAYAIFETLASRIKDDNNLAEKLARASNKEISELEFIDIAEAVAAFIRKNFKVETTKFHEFVFENGALTKEELNGGLLFYGKGGCSSCHSGPLFSDLEFHVIPFEQAGFGKNGFGVDYGLYNSTYNAEDMYRFRTPPLINVSKTSPYTHSGKYIDLSSVVEAHIDPLKNVVGNELSSKERRELTAKIGLWSIHKTPGEMLSRKEIDDLVSFLNTLNVLR